MNPVMVLGGGIIGLSCAVELQRRGHHVVIVDRAEPGTGCSYGNAGMIATSEVFPIISARRVIGLPRMLLDREGPAVIRPAGMAQSLPWLWRAAKTLTSARQRAITSALSRLQATALPAWRASLNEIGQSALLVERGMIEVARSSATHHHLAVQASRLAELRLKVRLLSGHEVRDLEPAIGPACVGGVFHENTAHVRDPFQVAQALLAAFLGRGGQLVRDDVQGIELGATGQVVHAHTASYPAASIVVAAGMASGSLLKPMGAVVPLQAERGYHLTLRTEVARLTRPLTFHRESCVASPLGTGLRLAGTVEFAPATAPPDWSRADILARHAQRDFKDALSTEGTRWIGSRPSLPDSLPAIGVHPGRASLAYAFGHQHLGLTQAAITASHVADLIVAGKSNASLTEFDLSRFGSWVTR